MTHRRRSLRSEAASVFSRVREAAGAAAPTTTARDASLNLAHVYLLQKRHVDAANIYDAVVKSAPAASSVGSLLKVRDGWGRACVVHTERLP